MLIDWVRSGRTEKHLTPGQNVRTEHSEVRTSRPRAKHFPVRPSHSVNKYILFFPQASERAGILEFDWLIIRTWPVQLSTIRPMGRIFSPLPKFRSLKLVVIVNLLPFLHIHQRLVNASVSLFTLKCLWSKKQLLVFPFLEYLFSFQRYSRFCIMQMRKVMTS